MSIDFGYLIQHPGLIFGLVFILLLVKLLVLLFVARVFSFNKSQFLLFSIILSQGGEFAFVLFTLSGNIGVLSNELIEPLVVVIAFSMATTPFLLLLNSHFIEPHFSYQTSSDKQDDVEDKQHPVIIAGFGRFGRVVGRLLHANHIPTTILDHEPDKIDDARLYGYKVYYGNVRKPALLKSAGADSAKIMIVCVDDPHMALDVIDSANKHFPHLTILSRAYDIGHAYELLDRGVTLFQREIFGSAMDLAEKALVELGYGAYEANQASKKFAEHDRNLFQQMYHADAIEKRISITRQANEELAKVLEGDEEQKKKGSLDAWE